jgi:membrane protein
VAGRDVGTAEADRQRRQQRQSQRVIERQITSRLPNLPARLGHPKHDAHRVWRWFLTRPLIANYLRDDGDGLATIIAFNALFSLLPFLLILFSLLSLFARFPSVHDQIQQWVFDALPPNVADAALKIVEGGSDNLGEVGVIAGVSLLLSGARFFGSLDRTFATIYRIPRRPFVERKLLALVMAPVVSLLMVGAAVTSTIVALLASFANQLFPVEIAYWLRYGLSVLVAFGTAFGTSWFLYTVVPHRSRHMRAWPGALTAAVLLAVLSQIFPIYVRMSSGGSLYGGVFALMLILMIWLYILGQIIVAGAEVNAMASGRKEGTGNREQGTVG